MEGSSSSGLNFGCDWNVSVSFHGIKKFSWERRLVLSLLSVVVLILFSWAVHTFTLPDNFHCGLVSWGSLFLGPPAVKSC